jgi:hypothetical protein
MTKKEIEYSVIKNTLRILCVMCAANVDKVIDILTGYLWDEEEAGEIKSASGDYDILQIINKQNIGR